MEIISKRLKKLREDAGLSQTKIGQLVGVPQSSIYRYEQGQSPLAQDIPLVCRFL